MEHQNARIFYRSKIRPVPRVCLFGTNLVNLFVVVVVFTLQRMTSILPGTLPQLGPDRHHGQVN